MLPSLKRTLFLVVLAGILPASARSAEPAKPSGPVLGSIDGAQSLPVRRGQTVIQAAPGTPLLQGDTVETRAKQAASVRNPDGSVILLGERTQYEIREPGQAVQSAALQKGTIRGIFGTVRKATVITKQPPKFRFLLRTRSAVMGVRGTDFVVTADESASRMQVHTLEGVVDLAPDEHAIEIGKDAVQVAAGQTAVANPEKIETPEVFDKERFIEGLKANQPSLARPEDTPPADEEPKAEEPPPAQEPERPAIPDEPKFNSKSFEFTVRNLGYRYTSYSSGGTNNNQPDNKDDMGGLGAVWAPTLRVAGNWFFVRGNLGLVKYSAAHNVPSGVWALEARVLASFLIFRRVIIEIGPGLQNWFAYGGDGGGNMAEGGSILIGWKFNQLFGLIDRVFISGGGLNVPSGFQRKVDMPPPSGSGTSYHGDRDGDEFRFGVGMRF